MKKTYHTTEQIIRILREAETSGQSHEELCRQHRVQVESNLSPPFVTPNSRKSAQVRPVES